MRTAETICPADGVGEITFRQNSTKVTPLFMRNFQTSQIHVRKKKATQT
jgi:hypothetical protein